MCMWLRPAWCYCPTPFLLVYTQPLQVLCQWAHILTRPWHDLLPCLATDPSTWARVTLTFRAAVRSHLTTLLCRVRLHLLSFLSILCWLCGVRIDTILWCNEWWLMVDAFAFCMPASRLWCAVTVLPNLVRPFVYLYKSVLLASRCIFDFNCFLLVRLLRLCVVIFERFRSVWSRQQRSTN